MMIRPLQNPYETPKVLRSFLYDHVVLALETGQVTINPAHFSKKVLHNSIDLRVEKVKKLTDVDLRSVSPWGPDEFLIFYGKGGGYESLFRRLRDAFAHGHYGSDRRGWITIWHKYRGTREKCETTRLFGRLRQSRLKNLITFLGSATSGDWNVSLIDGSSDLWSESSGRA